MLEIPNDVIPPAFPQFRRKRGLIKHERFQHAFQVLISGVLIKLDELLDSLLRIRLHDARAEPSRPHQNELLETIGVLEREIQGSQAAHRVTNDMNLRNIESVDQTFEGMCIEQATGYIGDDFSG